MRPTESAKALEAPTIEERLLRCDEVAELLRVGEDALAAWRRLGKGPPYLRYGARCVRYRRRDVELWLSQQEVQPSRLIRLTPNSGLGQYFERYERRTPAEGARAPAPASPASAAESRGGAAQSGERGSESR